LKISDKDILRFQSVVFSIYDYDYDGFSKAIQRSRIRNILRKYNFRTFNDLYFEIKDSFNIDKLILDFGLTYKELFRDPIFLKHVKKRIPYLVRNLDHINIWIPDCGDGSEVYTVAMMVEDLEIQDKTTIVATDLNSVLLKKAEEGVFSKDKLKKYAQNYEDAAGKKPFDEFFDVYGNKMVVKERLKKLIRFEQFNLLQDQMMQDFNVIFARNTILYYQEQYHEKIFTLINDSLMERGILCLGEKEEFNYSMHKNYKWLSGKERVLQKLK
jgi:chemotaxis protein methyltransferase CheR